MSIGGEKYGITITRSRKHSLLVVLFGYGSGGNVLSRSEGKRGNALRRAKVTLLQQPKEKDRPNLEFLHFIPVLHTRLPIHPSLPSWANLSKPTTTSSLFFHHGGQRVRPQVRPILLLCECSAMSLKLSTSAILTAEL